MKQLILILLSFLIAFQVQAETIKVPLSYLLPDDRKPVLRGQWDKISFPLTVLDNQQAENIRIALTLEQSMNMRQATLLLHIGNKPLATVQFDSSQSQKQVIAELTPDHLVQYGNQLTISVNHLLPSTMAVSEQKIEASEATTEILTDKSYFELTYSPKPYDPNLSGFSKLIKSGQFHQHPIRLESASPGYSDASLSVASLLVQGWTLRSHSDKYKFSYFPLSTGSPVSKSDVRLIYGTQTQLLSIPSLPAQLLNEIQGPFLGIHHDVKQKSRVLIVSGRDENELLHAAQHFAAPNFELPAQTYTLVGHYQPIQKAKLISNHKYPIEHFTNQLQFGGTPLTIPLMIPANILVNKEETAQINLLLNHPHIKPGEAAMVVRINGEYANSTPLRTSYWRDSQHYRLTFPMNKLRPGLNTLNIELYGPAQKHHHKEGVSFHPFTASISPTSNVKLGAWVTYLPADKRQTMAKELLVIAAHNGSRSQLTINYPEPSTLSEIWQLISFISLKAREPMPGLLLTTNPTQSRPLNLSFTVGAYQQQATVNLNEEAGYLNQLRRYLLSKMSDADRPESPVNNDFVSPFFQFENNTYSHANSLNLFGQLSALDESGWSRISFNAQSNTEMKNKLDSYLNKDENAKNGAIRQAVPNYRDDIQLARAGFIYHPYLLPLLIFGLIIPLAIFIQRQLGKKS
ncbi:hypothetical protein C942_04425 [Photobacterium marinum]|uniref:Cyclic di-GMP-binding protein n=1 Tax=Photobacterium marinum TaxID=1056511 RepID=L8JH27_9GAMM|nr:cellulose biosynthesis cyclic di-GMP-binding regulatory protein BcsB [Photobacterium marinum]ELR66727.1 hypothetical protein C942_04425 [Photobacterium marinum]